MQAQQRGSTLAIVMLLLVMGLMLLNAQHRQLDSTLLLAVGQQRYLRAYNQAASSLSWGLVQDWPQNLLTADKWHCQQQDPNTLRACARISTHTGMVLLRGAGQLEGSQPLWLYQLATLKEEGNLMILLAKKGGWLDFCPEKNERDCAQ